MANIKDYIYGMIFDIEFLVYIWRTVYKLCQMEPLPTFREDLLDAEEL